MGTTPATIQQLINAGTDCETIAAIANNTTPTTVDRAGNTKKTLAGVLDEIQAAGYVRIPVVTSAPTTAPPDKTGFAYIVFDSTSNKLWVKPAGLAWKSVQTS